MCEKCKNASNMKTIIIGVKYKLQAREIKPIW